MSQSASLPRPWTLPRALPGLIAAIAVVGAACKDALPARPPATLSVQLGTRQSCGLFSGLDYDTSCLAAVYVAARSVPSGQILLERCVVLDERKADLGQILRGAPLLETAGLSATGVVVFEVRGLHDAADVGADRCAEANVVDHWLFWGESDPVDLATLNDDGGAIATRIFVDCRDCGFDCAAGDCFGCQGIGETCPATLPTSFCVPGVAFRCDKRCEEDGDCFEGARRCDTGTCDTLDETGELCSPCVLNGDVVDGCNEGFACVGPPGATQGFCAMSCPDNFCPDGTRCNRVGNNLSIIGG